MSAHSPGPWTVQPAGNAQLAIRDPSGARVAVVVADHDTAEADARLIEAAPKLLAALKTVVEAWPPGTYPTWEALIARIEAPKDGAGSSPAG